MSAAYARDNDVDEVKHRLTDARAVCAALGLTEGYRPERQAGGGLLIRCPAHGDRGPSCSVTTGPDGTLRVRCFGCDLAGDVFNLIAAVRGLDVRRDFAAVKREAADLAGVSIDAPRSAPAPRPAVLRPTPGPAFPPGAEVGALWAGCGLVADDTEASAYLEARGLDVEAIDLFGLARVLPRGARGPSWARCGRPWGEVGFRLILPVYDRAGALRSVRAWRIIRSEGPKRVAPAGFSTGGLVLACGVGRSMLETGKAPSWFDGATLDIIIAEGEPDFLTWAASSSDANDRPPAVLGVVAGAWCAEVAARIPDGSRVVIRTHRDAAGDAYAAAIKETLAGRVDMFDLDRSATGDCS